MSDNFDSSTQRLDKLWKRDVISTPSEEAVERARSNELRWTSKPTTSSGVELEPKHQPINVYWDEELTDHAGDNLRSVPQA
jgi:hypothetical protein